MCTINLHVFSFLSFQPLSTSCMPFPCRSVMLAWISWGRRRNDEETNSEQNAKSRSSGCFLFFFLVRLVHAGLLVFSQRIVLLWKSWPSWPDVMWRWPSTQVYSSAWKWFLDFKFRIHSLHTGLSYCTKSTLYTGLLFFSQRIALVSRFALLDYLLPLASRLLPLRLPWCLRVLPSYSLLQTRFHCK